MTFGYLPVLHNDVDIKALQQIPIFSAGYETTNDVPNMLVSGPCAYLVTVIFGAIHCTAWNLHFPTHSESVFWRMCSVVITATPLATFFAWIVIAIAARNDNDSILGMVGVVTVLVSSLYIVARIALLVLAFTSLRALPDGALDTVAWVSFIPHV